MSDEKKYKLGYCSMIFDDLSLYDLLKECSSLCKKMVVGIPGDYVMARLFGDQSQYSAKRVRDILQEFSWVDDVLILEADDLSRQKIYEKVPYDVCFYGSEYGRQFAMDKAFMDSKGIDFISLMPDNAAAAADRDALSIALNNVPGNHKIVLFGTGAYFDVYMRNYGEKYPPAYALDNAPQKWNSRKNGILIKSPEELKKENPEEVMVILCSKNYQEMRIQLKSLGDVDYRTLLNNNTLALLDEFSLAYQGEQAYLKQAQEILMLLMKEFDRVCSKYGIQYYVICGSLIGVVRHHALIPWDDDIDIAMPREDYERLKKAAAAEWNNDEFSFVDYDQLGNGAFLDYMPRLFYNKATLPTKVYDKVQGKAKKQLQNRIFLDIYPMDNADDNEKKHLLVMNLMKGFYGLCMGHRAYVDYAEYERIGKNNLSWLRVAHTIGRCIPLKLLMAIYERLRRYANRKECENYYMATCAITCIERRFRKEFFGEGKRMKMGELEVTVPSDYDGLMKAMGYGNYMELPPLSIRKPSHYFNSDIVIW